MRIRVNAQDIANGIDNARYRCGCPIWQALNRHLGLGVEAGLEFINYGSVKIGKRGQIRLALPEVAIKWQHDAVKYPYRAKPFTFDAQLIEK